MHTDNALIHLGAALEKVGKWQTPMRLNDTTRVHFEKLATISTPEKAARYNALLNPAKAEEAHRYMRDNEPVMYSMLRISVVPTMMKAGVGAKVIPSKAEATLDIRARPDESIEKCYAEIAKVIDGATVMPSMSTGASEKARASARGQQSYGVGPAALRDDSTNFGAHSDVEWLAETSIYPFVEYVWNVVTGEEIVRERILNKVESKQIEP